MKAWNMDSQDMADPQLAEIKQQQAASTATAQMGSALAQEVKTDQQLKEDIKSYTKTNPLIDGQYYAPNPNNPDQIVATGLIDLLFHPKRSSSNKTLGIIATTAIWIVGSALALAVYWYFHDK